MSTCRKSKAGKLSCLALFLFLNSTHSSYAGELPILVEDFGTPNGQGQIEYFLTMQEGTMDFVDGAPATVTNGYNGNYLGPTLRMTKGDEVIIHVDNQLPIDSTTHWHGFHIPPVMDGGPWQIIEAGETWSPTFTIDNPAATFWFHPHIMPENVQGGAQDPNGTSAQVYRGLAGLIIVDDEESQGFALPLEYGVDDIPLIVQDREFDPITGEFIEFPIVNNGQTIILRKGTTILANGEIDAVLTSYAQMVRFRILNGSNARLYNLGLSDDQPFWQIGSDGGLLESPLQMTRLLLAPGERVEIVMDLADDIGLNTLQLMSFNSELGTSYVPNVLADNLDRSDFVILAIDVPNRTSAGAVFTLPSTLATIDRIPASEAVNQANPRPFLMGIAGGAGMSINGVLMDMSVINETIRLGDTEIWQLDNPSQQFHPIHVHGNAFQILTRNGSEQPAANEMGWKDVVIVPPGETVEIIKRFIDFADPDFPYMYHCHILEHEDAGMMGQFVVISQTVVPLLPLAGLVVLIAGLGSSGAWLVRRRTDGQQPT